MSNKGSLLDNNKGYIFNEQSRPIFEEWRQDGRMYNNSSSEEDDLVDENLAQLIAQNQKVVSAARTRHSADHGGMLNFDRAPQSSQPTGQDLKPTASFSIDTANFKINGEQTNTAGRNMLPSGGTLSRGARHHRSGNNTLNRRLMPTGQSMLTSSSSTISSVSNNIERDREARDTMSSRKMTDEPRYYVMEPDMPDIPPPDPAPPEVPPRAHSLYSASSKTSTSIRKKSDYVLKIDKNGDQTHEEYIPRGHQEYLRSSSPKDDGYPSGSPTYNGSQQNNRLQPTLQSNQQQMTQGMSSTNTNTGSRLGGSSPLVMPVFPLRTSHSGHAPHYSPYSPSRFHIDKRCQHRCSWKCFSIALILLSVVLTAMLAYFAATSSMKPNMDSTNCILVQDVKSNSQDQVTASSTSNLGSVSGTAGSNGGSTLLPTEESLLMSTVDHNSFTTANHYGNVHNSLSQLNYQDQLLQQQQQGQDQLISSLATQKGPAIVELKGFNELHHANIPPFQF